MNMKYLFCSLLVLASVSACAQPSGAPALSSVSLAPVVVPALPQSLEFAGEAVPLDNYDTRESLLRELMSCMYLHSRTTLTLLATTRYFPVIEPIMKKYGIPDDFKYLCMAESGLDPNVRSGAGAAGLWQLMPVYAKSVGLLVGGDVDERYDVTKATDSYYDLFLPAETLRYVFRVLAFKLIAPDPAAYGFRIDPDDYYKPLTDYHEATVEGRPIDWAAVARSHGTNYKMLRELNHWIRDYDYDNKAGRSFVIKVPNRDFRRAR